MMALVGRRLTSALYWLLKVAVPQIRGGRTVESGGCVLGILEMLRMVDLRSREVRSVARLSIAGIGIFEGRNPVAAYGKSDIRE